MKNRRRKTENRFKGKRGFTLIETLIALLLVTTAAFASLGMITMFAKTTRQDVLRTCLLQAASSGIETVRANPVATTLSVPCAGYTASVTVTFTGSLPATAPAMGSGASACTEIVSTATINGKTMELRDWICNFPGDTP